MHKRLLDNRFGGISGDISHQNAPAGASLKVDIVDPCRRLAHKAQLRGRVEQLVVNDYLIDYQNFAIPHALQRLLARRSRPADQPAQRLNRLPRHFAHDGRIQKDDFHTFSFINSTNIRFSPTLSYSCQALSFRASAVQRVCHTELQPCDREYPKPSEWPVPVCKARKRVEDNQLTSRNLRKMPVSKSS